jgi:hypothetical protein
VSLIVTAWWIEIEAEAIAMVEAVDGVVAGVVEGEELMVDI